MYKFFVNYGSNGELWTLSVVVDWSIIHVIILNFKIKKWLPLFKLLEIMPKYPSL